MMRRIACGLAGALVGVTAVTLLWWLVLAPCLLASGGADALSVRERLGTAKGAVLTFLPSPLGLLQGALVAAVRGRRGREVWAEVLWSPFAWVLAAGEGMGGAVVLLLSLLPGACVGMMVGLLLSGGREGQPMPDEALVGALVGVVVSLLGFNLYLQWPGLRGKGKEPDAPPAGGG